MLRVAIIVGSTRPGRKGEAVARWVYEIAGSRGDAEFELGDIASITTAAPTPCRSRYPASDAFESVVRSCSVLKMTSSDRREPGRVSCGHGAPSPHTP